MRKIHKIKPLYLPQKATTQANRQEKSKSSHHLAIKYLTFFSKYCNIDRRKENNHTQNVLGTIVVSLDSWILPIGNECLGSF